MTQDSKEATGPEAVMTRIPLGYLLVAGTPRGVCAVMLGRSQRDLEAQVRKLHPGARITRGSAQLRRWARVVKSYVSGSRLHPDPPLDVRATDFQRTVWKRLRAIPPGQTRTYGQVASAIGRPSAARAVARACASNPVCLVVPCHRVVRGDGTLGGYRWGIARKQSLLEREARRRHS